MSQRGRVVPMTYPGRPERVYTVSELTHGIKVALEESIGIVMVQGEIAALTRHGSGHTYFSLKDENAQIRIVLFSRHLTPGIREILQEGMAVRVEGEVTVYAKRGEYQIIASRVEAVGYGALQARFEALKKKLQLEGLFLDERKRPLPRYPTRIGIVTSATGAALHDVVRVLRSRAPYASITLADTRVQGEGADLEIAAAIQRMNAWGRVDILIVARGGGSPQDLWAFNEEAVVRAIAGSRIPVVSAVGHEVDVTLADLAADLRAATPTQAGSLVVIDQEEIRRTLRDLTRHARERIVRELKEARTQLRGIETHHALRRPGQRIQDGLLGLDQMQDRLSRALGDWVTQRRGRTQVLTARLRAHPPSRSFARARDRIESCRQRALKNLATSLARRRERVQSQARLLGSFDHHQVLERGYALIWSGDQGTLLKRGAGLRPSDAIEVQFFDARAAARVTEVVPERAEPAESGKETS
jgi:exodeoxyribonuclease VII large subunit